MVKKSIVKSIFNRFKMDFQKTKVWNDNMNKQKLDLTLTNNEEILISYINENNNYRWFLTNKRLLVPASSIDIDLSLIKKITFDDIVENRINKLNNNKLTLYVGKDKVPLYVEEKSWPIIYEIFNYIIKNSRKQ